MANEDYGGYALGLFVSKPSDHFICAICLDVVRQPHQCRNGHMFCKTCIYMALASHPECPTCRVSSTVSSLSVCLVARDLIDELQIKCDRKMCKWVGSVGSFTTHLKKHVSCTKVYDDGTGTYIGEWIDSKRNGVGKMFYANHDLYKGEWLDDKRHGKGRLIYGGNYDVVYRGEWENDKRHGEGIIRYASGDKYEGSWQNDEFCGRGIFTYSDGGMYDGQWVNNKRHGTGVINYVGKSIQSYHGEFKENKRHGFGTMFWCAGNMYEGQWFNNKRHGAGRSVNVDGHICVGVWKDDELHIQDLDYETNDSMYIQTKKKAKMTV